MSNMARMNKGHTKLAMLNDASPAIIQAVSVVPMFAPMMMLMACSKVSKEALTKETVITVVAVELCTAAVTPIPVSMPVKRLVVIRAKTCLNFGPAIFCNASLIVFMPKIRRASEPSRVKTVVIVMITYVLDFESKSTKKSSTLYKK